MVWGVPSGLKPSDNPVRTFGKLKPSDCFPREPLATIWLKAADPT
jgi:hypothetical protein